MRLGRMKSSLCDGCFPKINVAPYNISQPFFIKFTDTVGEGLAPPVTYFKIFTKINCYDKYKS